MEGQVVPPRGRYGEGGKIQGKAGRHKGKAGQQAKNTNTDLGEVEKESEKCLNASCCLQDTTCSEKRSCTPERHPGLRTSKKEAGGRQVGVCVAGRQAQTTHTSRQARTISPRCNLPPENRPTNDVDPGMQVVGRHKGMEGKEKEGKVGKGTRGRGRAGKGKARHKNANAMPMPE